jgi:hypothetical protein
VLFADNSDKRCGPISGTLLRQCSAEPSSFLSPRLRRRLSERLGEQAWRQSGLGGPDDIDQLQQRIVSLDVQLADIKIQLDERDEELAAARLANREMITSLNASRPST